jgi:acyl-CoA thioester hydrolase
MYISESKVRVRYGETDQMGYCYYGNYAQFFEIGRVEALRNLGVSYKSLEEKGIMLPVLDFKIKYLKPAFYDDELTIKTMISQLPTAKFHFEYETYNQSGDKINTGETTLVFVSKDTMRPTSPPQDVIEKLTPYLNHK